MHMKKTIAFSLFLLLWLLGGCASHKVEYIDPMEAHSTTTALSNADFNRIATELTDSLLGDPVMDRVLGRRNVVFVGPIKNRTYDHPDMEAFAETIQNELRRSGRFQIIDMKRLDEILDQWELKRSGLVDRDIAMRAGKLLDARYMISGALSSSDQVSGRIKDVSYKITLELLNLENGEILWSDETQIRKIHKRSRFGI